MAFEAYTTNEPSVVRRLQQDPSFTLEYINEVLGRGREPQLQAACARLAGAFDHVLIPPELIDPEEARIVLERVRATLSTETIDLESIP